MGLFSGLAPYLARVALIPSGFALDANANSLLRLYRDRLSRAFLFWFPLTSKDHGISHLDKLSEP